MKLLYITCGLAYGISFLANKDKTKKAFRSGLKMLLNVMPMFLMLILIMAISLYIIPADKIATLLNGNREATGIFVASMIGSLVAIPGFIAFPLSRMLLEKGVSYGILASFTTTLMMVGILTFPLEKKYFGAKLSLLRNVASYLIAIAVSLVISKLL